MITKRFNTRVLHLTRKYRIAQKNTFGAYHGPNWGPELAKAEYLLHEVAHWMTLGKPLTRVPMRLSDKIPEILNGMTVHAANALEIDTAIVTFLAGYALGLWEDPNPIVYSCRANLQGMLRHGSESTLYNRMVSQWSETPSRYNDMGSRLARWVCPRARLTSLEGLCLVMD